MMSRSTENIEVFGLAMQKMRSSLLKNLINIECYCNQSMNIVGGLQKMLIMYLVQTLDVQDVLQRFVFLRSRRKFRAQPIRETQCIHIKHLYYKYKPRRIAVDANGLGVGLIDYLVKAQDTDDGEYLPPFGIFNTDEYPEYKKFVTPETERDVLFLIKANAPINTEAYSYAQTQMFSGKIRFLIDESLAKTKLMSTKQGQNMNIDERNEYLRPFILTSILKEQMLNLVEENEGVNIILKQSNRSIKKDKFSAFIYGLYYIRYEEELNKKKKKRNIADFLFYTPS